MVPSCVPSILIPFLQLFRRAGSQWASGEEAPGLLDPLHMISPDRPSTLGLLEDSVLWKAKPSKEKDSLKIILWVQSKTTVLKITVQSSQGDVSVCVQAPYQGDLKRESTPPHTHKHTSPLLLFYAAGVETSVRHWALPGALSASALSPLPLLS